MEKLLLKLYITGKTSKSGRVIANLRKICDDKFCDKYELVIIDILENPQLAEDEKILTTPTLIKEFPSPIRRIIGDLADKEKVLLGLDLKTNDTFAKEEETNNES